MAPLRVPAWARERRGVARQGRRNESVSWESDSGETLAAANKGLANLAWTARGGLALGES